MPRVGSSTQESKSPEALNERRNHNTTWGPNSTPRLGSAQEKAETGKKARGSSLACLVLKKLPDTHPGSDTEEDIEETQAQADGKEGRESASRSQSLSRWKHSEIQVPLFLMAFAERCILFVCCFLLRSSKF